MTLIMGFAFESQDLENFISVNFRRGFHMSLAFYLFERGSHVISPAFEFQHFDVSHCLFEISNSMISSFCCDVFVESLDQEEPLWSH